MVSISPTAADSRAPVWWQRNDLAYTDGVLNFCNHNVFNFLSESGTPLFLYSRKRVQANIDRIATVLGQEGLNYRMFYAIKANRHPGILAAILDSNQCGIDACSPREVSLALESGFSADQISFTGTSVSNADLDYLTALENIHINCDSISTIRRLGQHSPGRDIGIRVNPQLGAGYHAGLSYHGQEKATKFGIYQDRFKEALTVASDFGFNVTRLHFHCGSGFLTAGLEAFEAILERITWFFDRCPGATTLNVGGGFGIPLSSADEPLDLAQWAGLIAAIAKIRKLEVHTEPGDYLVKDAGILLLEVNTVEEKGGTVFIGVNGGFAIQNLPVIYKTPLQPVPVREQSGAAMQEVTIAGHINEAIDLFAEGILLPKLREGDFLAFLNAGGYGASAASNHCMRGEFVERMVD